MAESPPEDPVAALLAQAAGLDEAPIVEAGDTLSPSPCDEVADPLAGLPPHTQGLLRIGVPVAVTLAAQRKSVQEIVELGPGAIIKFEKTCDEPLELCVGGQTIATGEVVKVGDKFGLKVRQLNKVGAAR